MSLFKRKNRTTVDQGFLWTQCRLCRSFECDLPDALLMVTGTKCSPNFGQHYDYRWEVRITKGPTISDNHTYNEERTTEAKFCAEDAYLKWKGIK